MLGNCSIEKHGVRRPASCCILPLRGHSRSMKSVAVLNSPASGTRLISMEPLAPCRVQALKDRRFSRPLSGSIRPDCRSHGHSLKFLSYVCGYCFTRFTSQIPMQTSASAMMSSGPKEEVSPRKAKDKSTLKMGLVKE